ncbi:unnamed protein product [Euphydryas editha]|uniref:MADF domain-containing protein n=1 Tax=Euphydryas editha TaxID=104508 RepID=A0AAU9UN78_EUPED|nr:unnamed protein product [Euphydryas editha]
MEWINEKVIVFLEILQTEPCLWDLKPKSFKNRASQNDAWRRIMELLPFKNEIKYLQFTKNETFLIYYKLSNTEETFGIINMRNKRKKMCYEDIKINRSYEDPLELKDNKKKDLKNLMKKYLIPNFYAYFYNSL